MMELTGKNVVFHMSTGSDPLNLLVHGETNTMYLCTPQNRPGDEPNHFVYKAHVAMVVIIAKKTAGAYSPPAGS